MYFINCFNKKVLIDGEIAGLISPDGSMYADGYKFGEMNEYGDISLEDEYSGFIDDNLQIYINGYLVGALDKDYNLCFDSNALDEAKSGSSK